MYKKDDNLKTVRGNAYIVATKTEYHIIDGVHPTLNDGHKLYPADSKDYVVAFENADKKSALKFIYEELTELELQFLIIK